MSIFNKINLSQDFLTASWFKAKYFTNFGYKQDAPSDKDYLFSVSPMASQNIGEDVDLRRFYKNVSDQYSLGSCCSQTTADCFEQQIAFKNKIDPSQVKDISRLFIYWCARNLMDPPQTNIDEGTRLRLCYDTIARYGACFEDIWIYDISKVNVRPSILAFRSAVANRISAFYRLDANEDALITQMKQALQAGSPISFGTQINDAFRNMNSDMPIQPPTSGFIGGHALAVAGYNSNKRSFIVRNSWGTDWNACMGGYCYMSENYFKADITRDLWVPCL